MVTCKRLQDGCMQIRVMEWVRVCDSENFSGSAITFIAFKAFSLWFVTRYVTV